MDAAYLLARLVLEYDGRANHVFETDRDHDNLRALRLAAADIMVLRITKGMLRDASGATRNYILSILADRLALGLPPLVPATPPPGQLLPARSRSSSIRTRRSTLPTIVSGRLSRKS